MVRLSIIVSSQRIADEPPDRRRVGLFHLRWTLQRSWLLAHRCWWQREDLKEVAIKRDEVLVDEGIAGHDVVIQRELQKRTDLIVAVVRQAVSVPDQDKNTESKSSCWPRLVQKPSRKKRCSMKAKLPVILRTRSGHRGLFQSWRTSLPVMLPPKPRQVDHVLVCKIG